MIDDTKIVLSQDVEGLGDKGQTVTKKALLAFLLNLVRVAQETLAEIQDQQRRDER